MSKVIWKCKDGREIPISEMTTEHITNSMRMLERMHKQTLMDISFPCFQGEMAQMFAEQEFDRLMDSEVEDLYPAYKHLRKELKKRNKK